MTPARLTEILVQLEPLGLSRRRLAALWGYASDNTVRQWERGLVEIPTPVAQWLRRFAAWAKNNPTGGL